MAIISAETARSYGVNTSNDEAEVEVLLNAMQFWIEQEFGPFLITKTGDASKVQTSRIRQYCSRNGVWNFNIYREAQPWTDVAEAPIFTDYKNTVVTQEDYWLDPSGRVFHSTNQFPVDGYIRYRPVDDTDLRTSVLVNLVKVFFASYNSWNAQGFLEQQMSGDWRKNFDYLLDPLRRPQISF